MDLFEAQSPSTPLTVADLSKQIHTVLDARVGQIDVIGQINKPSFKHHWYFSLTDAEASIDCAMWSSKTNRVEPKGWKPKQGDQVIIRGRIGHFAKYGKTQIYVERMKPAAQERGDLQLKYEALLKELGEAGWFDDANKKLLPAFPRRIAVITSATSAAVRDVIETARQRWAAIPLLIVNVPVQGDGAATVIAKAIERVDSAAESLQVDVIIVTRGGGSLEELWSFNERTVAEATFASKTPIVAAIGHESDTSIIELVADQRASTPTQAAMILVPDASELSQMVDHFSSRLYTATRRVIELAAGRIQQKHHQLDLKTRQSVHRRVKRITSLHEALGKKRPHAVLRARQERLMLANASFQAGVTRTLTTRGQRIETLASRLDAIGPQAVLKRGFSLTQDANGKVIRSSTEATEGQEIMTVLADGSIKSRVECAS